MTRIDIEPRFNIAETIAAREVGPEERSGFGKHACKLLRRTYAWTRYLPMSA